MRVSEPNPKKFQHLEVSIRVGTLAWKKKKGLAKQVREKSSEEGHVIDTLKWRLFQEKGNSVETLPFLGGGEAE